ncbi:unnamed protein product [Sphagnum jensenii]|uniref:Mitochondrial carrier protein n=1 Tax=Sphagnum jensenii TaxID=128206 RepID=A0ABP0W7K4_9BRYO
MAIRSLKSFTRSSPTKDGLGFSVATPSMSFASPPVKPLSSTISCSNSCWIGKEQAKEHLGKATKLATSVSGSVVPKQKSKLFAYDFVKAYLSPKDGTPGKLAFLPVSPIAGSCAGISSTVCMYPLELLKTRLTIQPNEYRGILHALWRIVSEEGVLELYRGLAPSVIGVIPYAGVNYFVYGSLRSLYKRCSKTNRVGNIQTLLIGSLAGAIASMSTFPLEVARKHMQVGALKGRVVYKGTLDALRGIAKERGLKGLYRGLGPSCLKLMPAVAMTLTTFGIRLLQLGTCKFGSDTK